jgi:hypothetical protein
MADKKISALTAATTPLAGTEVLPIVQTGTTVKASIANVQAAPVAVGTANAVQYLNASKVPTTSANLLFDGAVVAVGGTSSAWSGVGNVVQLTGTALWGSSAVGHVSLNTFFDGANYKYIATDFVTDYYQFGGSHVFRFAPSGTAGDNVAFTTAFSTTAAGNIAFPNGQGIDFSATAGTGTSELLSDYEEGTWTPELKFGNATTGITYSVRNGTYTKIGRQITAYCSIGLSSKGSATGAAELYGLPTALPTAGINVPVSVWASTLTYSGVFNFHAEGTTNRIALQQLSTLGVVTYLNDTNFANNTTLEISITYIV